MKKGILSCTVLLMLLGYGLGSAQEGSLGPGDETLTSGEYFHRHPYEASAGEQLTITLESAEFDPYLGILDPQGAMVFEEDDSAGQGLNVKTTYTFPSSGLYTLIVTSAYPGETGRYTLTLGDKASASLSKTPLQSEPGQSEPAESEPLASEPTPGLDVTQTFPEPPTTPPPAAGLEPFIVTGRVTDPQGNPMAGVGVFADNTFGYNANIYGVSDADGYYRIDVSGIVPSSWRIGAHHEVRYHGVAYTFRLHPDDASPFVGVDGAIRNLQWRLTGETPEGGFYGGLVRVYEDYMTYDLDIRHVELTFTPEGPLVDGSAGSSFSVTSPSGMEILDVPIGRYRIEARYQPPGEAPSPLLIQVRDQEDFKDMTTAMFQDHALYGPLLELLVKRGSTTP